MNFAAEALAAVLLALIVDVALGWLVFASPLSLWLVW